MAPSLPIVPEKPKQKHSIWIEYRKNMWRLIEDVCTLGPQEVPLVELKYEDVIRLLNYLTGTKVTIPEHVQVQTAIVPVGTPAPATGRFE